MLHITERGDGPAVLLIHGTGGDADAWGTIADSLSDDRRVIAYDRRGSTRSRSAGAAADWRVHARDAAGILSERVGGAADVVGWSSGAITALTLALDHPELVRSLVLIEPPLHGSEHKDRHLMTAFVRLQVLRRLGRRDAALDAWLGYITSLRSGGSSWTSPDYPPERREAYRANAPTVFVELGAKDDHLTAEALGSIAVPVTVVVGEESPEWFRRCARAAADQIPGARLELVPGMNHAISLSAPEAAASVIRSAAGAAQRV